MSELCLRLCPIQFFSVNVVLFLPGPTPNSPVLPTRTTAPNIPNLRRQFCGTKLIPTLLRPGSPPMAGSTEDFSPTRQCDRSSSNMMETEFYTQPTTPEEEFFNAQEENVNGTEEFREALEETDGQFNFPNTDAVQRYTNGSGHQPRNGQAMPPVDSVISPPNCGEPSSEDEQDDGAFSMSRSPTHTISGVGSDPEDLDDDIPVCFVNGCGHNMGEARRRWQITKKWRKDNNVDGILWEPQPNFAMIKSLYPHAVHKKSDSGHWIYIERPGVAKLSKVWKCGLTMADLERHYTFITEYLFRKIEDRPDAQIISIFDATGCKLTDLAGNTLKMFQRCSALVGVSYLTQVEVTVCFLAGPLSGTISQNIHHSCALLDERCLEYPRALPRSKYQKENCH